MELYLMQHGACLSKEIDPEQQLSPVGRDVVEKSAAAVRRMGLAFQAVLCSPKLRSRQTAEIVAQAVGFPVSHIYETEALKPTAPARDTLEQVRRFEKARAVFAAGHLPNLAEAVSLMACKGGRLELNIENAGLARIDLDLESGYGRLLWHLSAQHLQLIAQTL